MTGQSVMLCLAPVFLCDAFCKHNKQTLADCSPHLHLSL